MDAYIKATSILSDMGMNTLGANKDTIQLVREWANTLKPKCNLPSGKKKREIRKEDQTNYTNHDRESMTVQKTIK